ncbi:MAG: M20/M25/M40 family metallo-hydrolase [Methylocystis sp.]|nr:M20/M25/M40 family metallo-hydrolase [Methylocystis sp.]
MMDAPQMTDDITFLTGLISAGRAGEGAVQAIVAERLTRLGCAIDRLTYDPARVRLRNEFAEERAMTPDERMAVVARYPGTGGGRACILFAHPDSEPLPQEHGWASDPFAARLCGGRLHGWGVADDLSGVAAMVSGLELALAGGWRPRGDIIIASTPSKRHVRGVAAVLERIARPDAAIYLHPAESGAGMGEIKACTPGLLEFRVALSGRAAETAEPGHSAFAHKGHGVADVAATVIAALKALDAARAARVHHDRIEQFVSRASNILILGLRFGEEGNQNRMPVEGILEGAVSFPPGETLDMLMAELKSEIATLALPPAWPAELRPVISFPAAVAGAETPLEHPLFRAVNAAIRLETGKDAFVNPVHTASDIRVPIVQHGMPTVGLGPLSGDLTQNGRTNEWVDAQDHSRCVRVVAAALGSWCG